MNAYRKWCVGVLVQFLVVALLIVLACCAFGAEPTGAIVGVDTEGLTGKKLAKRRVTLTPEFREAVRGTVLVSVEDEAINTDAAGQCFFSNTIAGPYRLTIAGTPGTTYPLMVPTNREFFWAAALRRTSNAPAVNPQYLTTETGDARYYPQGVVDARIRDATNGFSPASGSPFGDGSGITNFNLLNDDGMYMPYLNSGVAQTPIMGYSTWIKMGCSIYEAILRAYATEFKRYQPYGYRYFIIDDGIWSTNRTADGNLQIKTDGSFTSTMPEIIGWLKTNGYKVGLYTMFHSEPYPCGARTWGSQQSFQDATNFVGLGADFIKLDAVPNNGGWVYYKEFIRAAQWAATTYNKPMPFIEISTEQTGGANPQIRPWVVGAGNGWCLITPAGDVSNGGTWKSTFDRWSMHLATAVYTRPGHFPSMDGLNPAAYTYHEGADAPTHIRNHMGLNALLSGTILVDDLQLHLYAGSEVMTNRDVIAINQDPMVGALRQVATNNYVQFLQKPLQNGDCALGLLNWYTNGPASVSVHLPSIGVQGPVVVRDLWYGTNWIVEAGWTVSVPKGALNLYRISPFKFLSSVAMPVSRASMLYQATAISGVGDNGLLLAEGVSVQAANAGWAQNKYPNDNGRRGTVTTVGVQGGPGVTNMTVAVTFTGVHTVPESGVRGALTDITYSTVVTNGRLAYLSFTNVWPNDTSIREGRVTLPVVAGRTNVSFICDWKVREF